MEDKAFKMLEDALCSTLVLALPNLQQPFEIEIDASQYALGIVLEHGGHPHVYYSKPQSQATLNYKTHNKELCTLVQALEQ